MQKNLICQTCISKTMKTKDKIVERLLKNN
jgi:hypothetical protein